jgi:hypothetical protein
VTRRAQENFAAAVLLVIFAGVIVMSLDFGPRARMIPLPLAIFGFALTMVQIIWQNLRPAGELRMDLISVADRPGGPDAGAAAEDPARASDRPSSWRREAAAYGIVAGLLALVLAVGPTPAIFLFTAGYFLATRHYSWRAGLVYTLLFTAAVYLLFFVLLEIQPYHGLLGPLIERFE